MWSVIVIKNGHYCTRDCKYGLPPNVDNIDVIQNDRNFQFSPKQLTAVMGRAAGMQRNKRARTNTR